MAYTTTQLYFVVENEIATVRTKMKQDYLFFLLHVVWLLCHYNEAAPASPIRRLGQIRGGSLSEAMNDDESPSGTAMIRVAYQGEPGAYSEKATRELLGPNVFAVGRPSFEAAFRAVASMEVDYACLPIENSLGGSIHENYDLMLRYQLCVSHHTSADSRLMQRLFYFA